MRIVPGEDRAYVTGPRYIDKGLLRVPPVAIGQTIKEIVGMLEMTRQMIRDAMEGFFEEDTAPLAAVAPQEEAVDHLQLAVTEYVTDLSQRQLGETESEKIGETEPEKIGEEETQD